MPGACGLRERFRSGRRRHELEDGIEKRREVHAPPSSSFFMATPSRPMAYTVREIRLLVGSAELKEELEHLLFCARRVGCWLVYLIEHDDGLEAELERLLQHEARLRHRAFLRVDDEKHGVDGTEHALHFRAEVGVARRVHDVYLRALVLDEVFFE
jgi:hypothetical protein